MTTSYHLSPHTFACLSGRYCMFLDIKLDRYISVPREAMEALSPWIHNWQLTPRYPASTDIPSQTTATLAEELLAAGVLTNEPHATEESTYTAPTPDRDLTSVAPEIVNTGTIGAFCLATGALLYASLELRAATMTRIIATARKRKHSLPVGSKDLNLTAALTTIFLKYRPLFPRNYRCLFDSLALLHFLSYFSLHPDWVFGVQDEPFSAHCWLQSDTLVLNDHLDHISTYTPIMTV